MLIESKIKRDGGTVITLGKKKYHFKDNGDDVHVCEVNNNDHIDRLLSISEGFREYRGSVDDEDDDAELIGGESSVDKSEELPDDPDTWTNKQCNDWASNQIVGVGSAGKDITLNPLNKYELSKFASTIGLTLDNRMNPANMIREIAKAVFAKQGNDI